MKKVVERGGMMGIWKVDKKHENWKEVEKER